MTSSMQEQPSLAAEIWKPVALFPGYYEVSNHGSVRSSHRTVLRGNGRPLTVPARVLAQYSSRTGHRNVKLYRGGVGTAYGVHRLVMAAFVGPCPEGMEVCHNNGDPTDNRLSNLRYDTRSKNILDSVHHGTNHWTNRTRCPRGHELVDPNLVPSMSKRGSRACLACNRARSYVRYHPEASHDHQSISDSYFEAIIQEVS